MLWALFAWLMIATTVFYSAEPRYYLMIVPILLLSWLTMLLKLSEKLPRRLGEVVLVLGLGLVTLNNITSSISFIKEQRAGERFLEVYKNGKWLPAIRMAKVVRERVPPGETVIGPSGSVMSLPERAARDHAARAAAASAGT